MKVVILTVFLFIGVSFAQNDNIWCDKCLPNGVACVSEREFKICRGSESPANGTVHTCSETEVCTDEDAVCMEKIQVDENGQEVTVSAKCKISTDPTAPSEKLGDCEVCVDKYAFACVGPSTYALCMGKIGTGKYNPNIIEECPENYICNTATSVDYETAIVHNPYYPCVPSCAVS